jgi:hypothetical protein
MFGSGDMYGDHLAQDPGPPPEPRSYRGNTTMLGLLRDHAVDGADIEAYDDTEPVEEIASAKGCRVVYPTPRELQLDLDDASQLKYFWAQWNRLYRAGADHAMMIDWDSVPLVLDSSTKGHFHVIVKLSQPLDVPERILLQALLGSDRTREMLNFRRWLQGMDNPIRLFRPHDEAAEVLQPQPLHRGLDEDDDLPF